MWLVHFCLILFCLLNFGPWGWQLTVRAAAAAAHFLLVTHTWHFGSRRRRGAVSTAVVPLGEVLMCMWQNLVAADDGV